jgi:hypothetical protein
MRIRQCAALFFGLAGFAAVLDAAPAAETPKEVVSTVVVAASAKDGQPVEPVLTRAAGVVLAASQEAPDACLLAEVTANPTRPNWDTSASTTQCGIIETDYGWMSQPMGSGVNQWMLISSMRYGLTPKLDLRWGLTNHINQSGGGTQSLEGVGDQWLNARYRFVEQSKWMPAVAFDYGFKIPMANPAKGFGSGFVDHQFAMIASRDLGKYHFDFNTVGTVVGGKQGHDGAAQFGLALTRSVTPKLSWIAESYGGPQPGTSNRFGAAFAGASYILRQTLVMDIAYSRTYTAGSPRQQFLFGFTFAMRPSFSPLPKGSSFARLLGR